jgi:hypothetical protein
MLPLHSFFSASIQKGPKFSKNPPFPPPKTHISNPQTLPPNLHVIKPLYTDFRHLVLSNSARWRWCCFNTISTGAHVCWFMDHKYYGNYRLSAPKAGLFLGQIFCSPQFLRFGISKRKRERNVEIFISHKSLFSSHSHVLLAVASG